MHEMQSSLLDIRDEGAHLAGGERLDAPEQLWDILDGHLEAESVPPEQHGLGLLQQPPASAALAHRHLLGTDRDQFVRKAGKPRRTQTALEAGG